MEQNTTEQLKQIDLSKPSFMANGKEYFFESQFTIDRFCKYQELEKELAYGYTTKTLYAELVKMWNLLNAMKFAEIATILHNLIHGLKNVQEREPVVLKMCALFINTKDEDRRIVTDDMISRKIDDWKEEGYNFDNFFKLALNTMDGFLETYRSFTQSISQVEAIANQG